VRGGCRSLPDPDMGLRPRCQLRTKSDKPSLITRAITKSATVHGRKGKNQAEAFILKSPAQQRPPSTAFLMAIQPLSP